MISIDRAKRIIQCYGANPFAWPEQERQATQQLLLDSKSLSDFQQQAHDLDQFMGLGKLSDCTENLALDQQCAVRIMSQLPEQQSRVELLPISYLVKIKQKLLFDSPILLVASLVLLVFGLSSLHFNYQDKAFESLSYAEYISVYVDEQYISDDEELEVLAFLEPQLLDDY